MCNLLPSGMFLAIALVSISPDGRLASIVNAGLPDVLLVRTSGRVDRVVSDHVPLGIVSRLQQPQFYNTTLASGDRILVYSDGVIEARNLDNEDYGERRLIQCCAAAAPGERIVELLQESLRHFVAGQTQFDDISMIEYRADLEQIQLSPSFSTAPSRPLEGASGSWHWSLELHGQDLARMNPVAQAMNQLQECEGRDEKWNPVFTVLGLSSSLKPYECDGLSVYCEMPLLVVLPETVEQAQQVLRICHREGVPVVARGAGTGLCAGAMPHAHGVVLSLARFSRILEIDPLARVARVQPGVRNLAISEAAAKHGLYYGPDPSSQIACTIGGNVAENSGGVHCLKYGLTVHNLLSVEILTVEGERLTLGSEGLDSCGADLLALMTGSEGLLGIVTEVRVKLLPRPEVAQVVMAGFDSVQAAGDAVGAVIGAGIIPGGLEMMDGHAIVAAEAFANAGYPTSAEALLLCEVDGTAEEVHEHIEAVEQLFRRVGASSVRTSHSEEERARLWAGRKSAFPAVGRISPDYYCMDGTIPRSQLAYVLTEMQAMSAAFGLRVANVFHAGDGNLHPLILFDAAIPGELERAEAFGARILELCVEVGGCITGEHGVGVEKIRQMPVQFNDQELAQFHRIKAAFDPAGTLNPGKGIPTLRQCQEYRSLDPELTPNIGAQAQQEEKRDG